MRQICLMDSPRWEFERSHSESVGIGHVRGTEDRLGMSRELIPTNFPWIPTDFRWITADFPEIPTDFPLIPTDFQWIPNDFRMTAYGTLLTDWPQILVDCWQKTTDQ